jgi:hypothetical protein
MHYYNLHNLIKQIFNSHPVNAANGQLNRPDKATANIANSSSPSSQAPKAKAVMYIEKAEGKYAQEDVNIPAENNAVTRVILATFPPNFLRTALRKNTF